MEIIADITPRHPTNKYCSQENITAMSDFSPNTAADFWSHLRSTIRGFLQSTMLEWRYPIDLDVSKETAQTLWLADCMACRHAVDELAHQLITTGSVREEDPKRRYFLCARFAAVLEILQHFSYVAEGSQSTVFLPVYSDPKEQLSGLLVDWWWGHGIFLAFELAWERKMFHGLLDE